MRRKDKHITDTDAIRGILRKARVCRLAMVDGDSPYVVPLSFGFHDGTLYFHTALKGKKIDLLRKNPRVCFEVDTVVETVEAEAPCEWTFRYQSVIGFGRARFLEDPEEKRRGLEVIFRHYAGRAETFSDEKIRATEIIRVDIETMTGKGFGV